MPGFAFATVGRLGLSSPPSRPLMRPSLLCSAKTTASPSRVASLCRSLPNTSLAPHSVRVPLGSPAGWGQPARAWPFGIPVRRTSPVALSRGDGGPLEFPGYPFAYMPRSQTPVVSSRLALSPPGRMPSGSPKPSAFPSSLPGYPLGPQQCAFRSSTTRPTRSLHLASHTPLRDMHAGSLQARWLTSSGGT